MSLQNTIDRIVDLKYYNDLEVKCESVPAKSISPCIDAGLCGSAIDSWDFDVSFPSANSSDSICTAGTCSSTCAFDEKINN